MDISYRRPLSIAIVVTRNLSEHNGRTPILSHIVRTLDDRHDTELLRLSALVESPSLRDIAGALVAWLGSLLRGRPLPLQCVLYGSPRRCRSVIARIAEKNCDAVYLDTVRCQLLLRMLRRALPGLHIVTDFDDLMSRRALYLFQNGLPFAAGHVGRHVPRWLHLLSEKLLAGPIAGYEAFTLPTAEDEVIATSDATILVSNADRDKLKIRTSVETVHAIPPPVPAMRAPVKSVPPGRFVFIGSDNFVHNRAAIAFLLESWDKLQPSFDLHIYGRQSRTRPVKGVHWHGFVEDIADVYQPGSIALAPAMDRGGIKMKVLEAWAWGCPVLCNRAAMEGLPLENYPFVLPEAEWPALLTAPLDHMPAWANAADTGYAFVRDHFSAGRFERAWQEIICPAARGTDIAQSAQIALRAAGEKDSTQKALATGFAKTA